jgi:hypothetical protein
VISSYGEHPDSGVVRIIKDREHDIYNMIYLSWSTSWTAAKPKAISWSFKETANAGQYQAVTTKTKPPPPRGGKSKSSRLRGVPRSDKSWGVRATIITNDTEIFHLSVT